MISSLKTWFKRFAANALAVRGSSLMYDKKLAPEDRLSRAEPLFQDAISRDPNCARALRGIGWCKERSGDIEGAVAAYRSWLLNSPSDDDARTALASAIAKTGAYQEAIQILRDGLSENSNSVELWFRMGMIQGDEGCHTEALDSYNRVLALKPGHAPAMGNAGFHLFEMGKTDEGIALVEKAVACSPDMWGIRMNLAYLYHDAGRYAEAAHEMETAAGMASDSQNIRHDLARMYMDAGRHTEAEAEIETLKRLDEKLAREARAYLEGGE